MVRFDAASNRRAAIITLSAVAVAIAPGNVLNSSTSAMVSKYPNWWAMFVTLSFSKTSRASSWALAFASSIVVIPSRCTRSSSSSRTPSAPDNDVPSVAVADTVYRNGCAVGTIDPDTLDARPRSTSAR